MVIGISKVNYSLFLRKQIALCDLSIKSVDSNTSKQTQFMKTAILIPVCFVSMLSFGQNTDKLVAEVSPINTSLHRGIYLNIQGKLSYTFNRYLSLTARHNQEILGGWNSIFEYHPKSEFRRNSLSDLTLGISLYHSKKPRTDPTEEARTWYHKQLQLDLGLCYFKYANHIPEYYSYELDNQGNYRIINSINRFSASLGFSYILRENNITDPNHIKLRRQHTFSAGAYYGIHYDLQGYIKSTEGNSPQRAPKNYTFRRNGYYVRYNFRQQITKHWFLGADVFFSKMPYVNYKPNKNLYFLRGGESEPGVQLYTGIIVGWVL